ncbi:hypothetical protein RV14_GL000742 [Enterococcus ratti]|uniref:Uncharacterized protein n=1 Tax=Enterococcus ratti TaxID=150033 RepID=A0A1L8WGC0_9ENTE|nr:hypothetical protein RV14_GL000742 [Enterococcus ratti]
MVFSIKLKKENKFLSGKAKKVYRFLHIINDFSNKHQEKGKE